MNGILIFAILSALAAAGSFTWAMLERDRATRAEADKKALENMGEVMREQMAQSAAGVAQDILRKNEEEVQKRQEQAHALMAAQLKPVADKLSEFQKHVAEAEKARAEESGVLKTQIGHMIAAANTTREETQKLTNALRRGAGIQGRWGEQMLRNVLELAGLRAGVDFEEQVHTADEDGTSIPDVVVRLPGASYFVIDAKVSLAAYETFLAAQDDLSREVALRAHCESVRRHVTQLASKNYWAKFDKPPKSRSPDLVVMFVPLESAYACAVEALPALVAEAWDKKVAIVTPSAMFPLLRAVAYGWRAEDQAANAREIAAAGRELHKRVALVTKYAAELGGALNKAVGSYNDLMASFQRNVITQAKRLESMSVKSERPLVETPAVGAEAKKLTKLVAAEGDELAALTVEDS